MKQLLLIDCLVWDEFHPLYCPEQDVPSGKVSSSSPLNADLSSHSYEGVGMINRMESPPCVQVTSTNYDRSNPNFSPHSNPDRRTLSRSDIMEPSKCSNPHHQGYILTNLDNAIIQTISKIGRPCTPDDIILELEMHDWGVKPRTIQRHIERLGQYKIITRIKKGVYIL